MKIIVFRTCHYSSTTNKKFSIYKKLAEELTQCLRVCTVLLEDLSLIPGTLIRGSHDMAYNSSHTTSIFGHLHSHTDTHTHDFTCLYKI